MTQKLFENQSQHMNASFSNYLSSSEIHFSISCVIRFVHKMSKQLTKFSSKWKKKFAWVESVPNNIHKAYCKYCKEEIKIGHIKLAYLTLLDFFSNIVFNELAILSC